MSDELTNELAWAGLVAHAINSVDYRSGPGTCCPHVCMGCAALDHLHVVGLLDDAVRPYVTMPGGTIDWDWWDRAVNDGRGGVRWASVSRTFCSTESCPDYDG